MFSTSSSQSSEAKALSPVVKIDSIDIAGFKLVGSGLTSKVYCGQWNDMEVAVKMLSNHEGWAMKAFQDEKEIMEKLALRSDDNPYIVKLFGVVENTITQALVIEYLSEGDIIDYINKHERPNQLELHHLAQDGAYALAYLHANGIIHCDIKPDNFMVYEKDRKRTKLIDFGFSIFKNDSNNKFRELRGTASYVAPELAKEAPPPYSEKSDVYAYAIVLYSLYTRKEPYPEHPAKINTTLLLQKVAYGNKRPSAKIDPESVSKLIHLGWLSKPELRRSAEEIGTEFDEIIKRARK